MVKVSTPVADGMLKELGQLARQRELKEARESGLPASVSLPRKRGGGGVVGSWASRPKDWRKLIVPAEESLEVHSEQYLRETLIPMMKMWLVDEHTPMTVKLQIVKRFEDMAKRAGEEADEGPPLRDFLDEMHAKREELRGKPEEWVLFRAGRMAELESEMVDFETSEEKEEVKDDGRRKAVAVGGGASEGLFRG